MPIYLGGTRIDSLKLGGQNIAAGYLGDVQVFGADPEPPGDPTVEAVTTARGTDPTGFSQIDVSWPAAATSGRYAVMFITRRGSAADTRTDTGGVFDEPARYQTGTLNNHIRTALFTRSLTGTEGSAFTINEYGLWSATLVVLSGVDDVAEAGIASTASSLCIPSVDAPAAGVLLSCWGARSYRQAGEDRPPEIGALPSGMTERSRIGWDEKNENSRAHVVASEDVGVGATGERCVASIESDLGRVAHINVVAYTS